MGAVRTTIEELVGPTRRITESVIWCTVCTVDTSNSPRVRLMHPVWFWEGGVPVGLVTARPTPLKVRHLAANPTVSCFYWDPQHHTVAIDAVAAWLVPGDIRDAWNAIEAVPEPVGFDPATIWPDGPGSIDCGILRFDPYRIVTTPVGAGQSLWSRPKPAPNDRWAVTR